MGFVDPSHLAWHLLNPHLASRGAVLHAWGKDKVAPREKVSASAIAGAVGGAAGGLLR